MLNHTSERRLSSFVSLFMSRKPNDADSLATNIDWSINRHKWIRSPIHSFYQPAESLSPAISLCIRLPLQCKSGKVYASKSSTLASWPSYNMAASFSSHQFEILRPKPRVRHQCRPHHNHHNVIIVIIGLLTCDCVCDFFDRISLPLSRCSRSRAVLYSACCCQ